MTADEIMEEALNRPANRHCVGLREAVDQDTNAIRNHLEYLIPRIDALTLKRWLRRLVDETEDEYQDFLSRPQA